MKAINKRLFLISLTTPNNLVFFFSVYKSIHMSAFSLADILFCSFHFYLDNDRVLVWKGKWETDNYVRVNLTNCVRVLAFKTWSAVEQFYMYSLPFFNRIFYCQFNTYESIWQPMHECLRLKPDQSLTVDVFSVKKTE